jgi:S-methylmethionine-dependent homocysteine/selenocysteine methylase
LHRAEGITTDVGGNRGIDLLESLAHPGEKTWILDGATGTELERRGVRADLPLWSAHALVERPEQIAAIHAEYVAAGADLLTANTFRTQARTLARAGLGGLAAELTTRAVSLARQSAGPGTAVLGSAPPLEDCFRPDRVPEDDTLAREHAAHAEHLAAAGVDAVLVETMNCEREARAALRAARSAGLPTLVSFCCNAQGGLLSGEALQPALDSIAALGPIAVGVNCVPPASVAACLPALVACGVPFLVSPNQGPPRENEAGRHRDECSPEELAALAEGWRAAGARILGGCCGTTPAHIEALAFLGSS